MLLLTELAAFLDQRLERDRVPAEDQNGIYRASDRPIQRLGLALEPWADMAEWVRAESLDALFLHRPWKLDSAKLADDIGIVAYHLAFDERLTVGLNPDLAIALGLTELDVLGTKHNRPIGMIGNVPPQRLSAYCDRVRQCFGGAEFSSASEKGEKTVSRVAVVGAMDDALVREAHDHGAQLYVTGQVREAAALAVEETAIAVVAVGHHRAEMWGLQTLAAIVSEHWSTLQVRVALGRR
ncbi:Nif3-like dinuclear metal center hexameric protein [Leptolyngbya sp. FACHB-36]|uniref:Nif3-like dinuclear metal center hexameric protein n=1 Tax=Leptolyngbya sp. FACHB-36 TaxID=2692808 RepID=UPI00168080F5|nr:Nif3-like dinuclear metal center hexameric protein [Leptolyngbya sp. FACHB-36]MBD2021588.1 Nif3-like dinuclear metal center hexameric protein [Leptolyngbya sp. FACHB-36]